MHKVKFKKSHPRDIETITKEYAELCQRSGQIQYQVFVLQQDIANMNKRMVELNKEGAKRQELNAQETSKQVTASVPELSPGKEASANEQA